MAKRVTHDEFVKIATEAFGTPPWTMNMLKALASSMEIQIPVSVRFDERLIRKGKRGRKNKEQLIKEKRIIECALKKIKKIYDLKSNNKEIYSHTNDNENADVIRAVSELNELARKSKDQKIGYVVPCDDGFRNHELRKTAALEFACVFNRKVKGAIRVRAGLVNGRWVAYEFA